MVVLQNVLGKEYKFFNNGSYVNKMYELINTGFSPFSVADIMRARLETADSNDPSRKDFWLDHYFDSVDGVAYLDDKIKLSHSVPALVNINPGAKLSNGALPLSVGDYGVLSGVEFSRRDLERAGLNRPLSKDGVNAHPIWIFLAEGDKALLREYSASIFSEGKERFGYDEMMGIYLRDEQPESPVLRAWVVYDLLYFRSYAVGSDSLNDLARLVGVRSSEKARSAMP